MNPRFGGTHFHCTECESCRKNIHFHLFVNWAQNFMHTWWISYLIVFIPKKIVLFFMRFSICVRDTMSNCKFWCIRRNIMLDAVSFEVLSFFFVICRENTYTQTKRPRYETENSRQSFFVAVGAHNSIFAYNHYLPNSWHSRIDCHILETNTQLKFIHFRSSD